MAEVRIGCIGHGRPNLVSLAQQMRNLALQQQPEGVLVDPLEIHEEIFIVLSENIVMEVVMAEDVLLSARGSVARVEQVEHNFVKVSGRNRTYFLPLGPQVRWIDDLPYLPGGDAYAERCDRRERIRCMEDGLARTFSK